MASVVRKQPEISALFSKIIKTTNYSMRISSKVSRVLENMKWLNG
jgi:hypothetical protein